MDSKFYFISTFLTIPKLLISQDICLQNEYNKLFGAKPESKESADSMNVLLITSDQHHWMAVGYNDPKCKTPNLDRLAKYGVVFDRAYTTNPTSTPARASIITGMYPSQHGAYALGTKLMENVPCLGDYLNDEGYQTALVGKAHFQPLKATAEYPSAEAYPLVHDLEFWEKFNGPFYGFNHVELTRNHGDEGHVGQHYALWLEDKVGDKWKEWFCKPLGKKDKKEFGEWSIPERYHMNAWITERCNSLIDDYIKEDKRFFIWASFFDPHPPYLLPEPWASMYNPDDMDIPESYGDDVSDMPLQYRMTRDSKLDKHIYDEGAQSFHEHGVGSRVIHKDRVKVSKAYYYGMISMMDYYIGKILDKLEQENLLNKTLIIFTTDHGNFIGEHGLGAKGVFDYEDGVKIPFIASCPGVIPEGRRTNALVSLADIAPTVLDFLKIKIPSTMTGVSQLNVMKGTADKVREHVFIENHFQMTKFYFKTYVNGRYKLSVDMNSNEGELFDLENDPNEMENLWDNPNYKDIKRELLLEFIQKSMKTEPVVMPRIAVA